MARDAGDAAGRLGAKCEGWDGTQIQGFLKNAPNKKWFRIAHQHFKCPSNRRKFEPPVGRTLRMGTKSGCRRGTLWLFERFSHIADVVSQTNIKERSVGNLLHYAIVFLVVALVAAFLGFGGVAGTAMEGARILFWVAIVLLAVSLIANFVRKA